MVLRYILTNPYPNLHYPKISIKNIKTLTRNRRGNDLLGMVPNMIGKKKNL